MHRRILLLHLVQGICHWPLFEVDDGNEQSGKRKRHHYHRICSEDVQTNLTGGELGGIAKAQVC